MKGEHAAVLAVVLYLFLRWGLHPLACRLPNGLERLVDLTGALFLLPEYLTTRLLRLLITRPMPLAHLYGEAVSGLAVLFHALGQALAEAIHQASSHTGHRQAVIGSLIGTACVALVS